LGVGCAAGSPPGPTLKRALGRSLAACFAPPWLVHLSPTSPPPPTSPPTPTSPPPPPKGREREPRAAAYPLNTPRGPKTPYIRRYREAEEKILGVGCSILGVGCLRIWALGVYHGFWALGGTDHLLGVGCLWRRRWVVLEDPERRQRGGSTSTAACLDLSASRVV
jgi:hypothetical protein